MSLQTFKPVKLPRMTAPKRNIRRMTDVECLDLMERVRAEFGSTYALQILDELIEAMRRRAAE